MISLEQLHQVVVQGFASINSKLDAKVDALETKIGALDAKIDGVDAKLDAKVDALEAKMDAGFARIDQDFAFVKRAITDHTQELKEIRATLDKKVDRDEVEAIVERAVARAIGS